MRPPKASLFLLFAVCAMAQQGLIPTVQSAFKACLDGDQASADNTLRSIEPKNKAAIVHMFDLLDRAMGLNAVIHKPSKGLAAGYSYTSSGFRYFFTNYAFSADRLFRKGASHLQPIFPLLRGPDNEVVDQPVDYLFNEFLLTYICANPIVGCTPDDKTAITDKTRRMLWSKYIQRIPDPIALNTPSRPDGTIPEPAFQDLLNALAKADIAGAAAIVSHFSPQDVNATEWARLVMNEYIGHNPHYLNPYGAFPVIDRLSRALMFAVKDKNEKLAVRATNNVFTLQPCLDFNMIVPTAVDDMAAYISRFFDSPTLFGNAYQIRPNMPPPPRNFEDAAYACTAAAENIQ